MTETSVIEKSDFQSLCSSTALILSPLLLLLCSVPENNDQKRVIPIAQNEDLQPSHCNFSPFASLKQKGHYAEVWWCWKQNASKTRALLLIWWCKCSSLKLYRAIAQLQENATLSKQITVGDGGEKHIMLSSQEKLLWSTFKTIHQSHLQLSSQNEHN